MTQTTNVGIVGCGNISGIYLEAGKKWDILNIAACADIALERAQAQAAKYGVPEAGSVAELLADPSIDIVINLTIPAAHAEVALAALSAGKSVYNEKPLALDREQARQIIDEGVIGEPIGASAFMMSHGPEGWHPSPEFFYQPGAGPMFDMGPYYLTSLTTLLGPVRRVTGSTRVSFPERVIGSEPLRGQVIKVNTPTHIIGVLDFTSGPIATIVTSFDVWSSELPRMEIYGSKGTLSLPDPNTFGGPVRVRLAGEQSWSEVPIAHGYTENSRGLGVADMADAIQSGRTHRANGELAFHVLDLMHTIHDASREGRHIDMTSSCERPEPLPEKWTA
jgi:predicted dehydrogenase